MQQMEGDYVCESSARQTGQKYKNHLSEFSFVACSDCWHNMLSRTMHIHFILDAHGCPGWFCLLYIESTSSETFKTNVSYHNHHFSSILCIMGYGPDSWLGGKPCQLSHTLNSTTAQENHRKPVHPVRNYIALSHRNILINFAHPCKPNISCIGS